MVVPLAALAGAAVLVTAGCGGKSADQKARETYANSVCSAIAGWQTQAESIATDLSGGISRATLQTKVTEIDSATVELRTQIKAIPKPNTSGGQAAKQQLDQLSTELAATVGSVKTAVAGLQADSSAASVAGAVLTLAPQVKSLATTAQTTVSTLRGSEGNLASAFKSADSCKSLESSS
jgi:hypothetical protein